MVIYDVVHVSLYCQHHNNKTLIIDSQISIGFLWKNQRHSFSVELHIDWQKQAEYYSVNILRMEH